MVTSPCTKVCTLDERKVCVGCKRTLQEIKDWSKMTDREKQEVIQRISLLGDQHV